MSGGLNSICMFADDTKIWAVINSDQEVTSLQSDLDELAKWSDKWSLRYALMQINVKWCTLVTEHQLRTICRKAQWGSYYRQLAKRERCRSLVTSDLKPSVHCGKAAAKTSSVLGLIQRHFKYIKKESFLILYKAYIRPHLEYCVQSWSPSLVKDITCLQHIRHRATKMVDSLCKISYSECLNTLGLTTLATRCDDDDDEIAYFTVRWKTRASFVYRTKNTR